MTDTPAAQPDDQFEDLLVDERAEFQRTLRGRVIFGAGIAVSVGLCVWLAGLFSIPDQRGFTVSLLQQPHWFIPLVLVGLMAIVTVFIAGTITRSLRNGAALVCVGLALASISLRGGPMRYTLFAAGGPKVFIGLAFETILLFGFLVVAWAGFCRSGIAVSEADELPAEDEVRVGIDDQLLAGFTHAVAMTILMILLCRSDAKLQTVCSVAVSAAVASFIVRQVVTLNTVGWLWLSPLLVALVGYMAAWLHPETMQIGILHGVFAPLARPLPLEYAGMGAAGTVVGFWMGAGEAEEESVESE